MTKVVKSVLRMTAVIIPASSVVAGILDTIDQKKREKKAKAEGREIIKRYGPYEKYFKRSLDFGISSLVLIILSPVMLITAVLVKRKLGSPVFFIQERPGKDEKIFRIYKFRTMSDERGFNGELLPDTERLGKFGNMLRKTSIDELPELFNIMKGDMSIIGPRPLIPRYLSYYTETEKHRHDVRPGLSGLAQTNGRNALSWEERFAYDVEYVKKITFKADVSIVIKTIQKVLKAEDIVVRGMEGSILDLDVERMIKQKEKEV